MATARHYPPPPRPSSPSSDVTAPIYKFLFGVRRATRCGLARGGRPRGFPLDMKPFRTELGEVTPHNIKQLKRLNQVIFPVFYNDKFYKDVLEVGELARLAYFNDIVVGAVCCRVDFSNNQKRLYIMTLGCLARYRRLGIGTKMLNHVLAICEKDGTYDNIFLHVQVNNESAMRFYREFGFEVLETKAQYYKRIEPADAHVLQKTLRGAPSARGILALGPPHSTSHEAEREDGQEAQTSAHHSNGSLENEK
ncbi:N-alpha-acetyltransferase 50 [Lampetra planeri]